MIAPEDPTPDPTAVPLPKGPHPDFKVEHLPENARALLQHGLDLAVTWPRWTVLVLIGFALALVLLGRHGQRLLAGTALGAAVIGLVLVLVRPQYRDEEWPGFVAIIGGGAAFALGLGVPGWTTALVASVSLGAIGAWIAIHIAVPWLAFALPFALAGLFLGLANHLWWGLWMPPIAAALALALAAARLLGPADEDALVPQLLELEWALAVFGAFAIALLAISLEREHLRKKKIGTITKERRDAELKDKMKRDRERHDKHLGVNKDSPS